MTASSSWCGMRASIVGLLVQAVSMAVVWAQIRLSSDLNCDFAQQCRWRNDTMQPESVGWAVTSDSAQVANSQLQFPMSDGTRENFFIYSVAPPGRHESSFVSDIVPCQLGGARLKFWYYFTGKTAALDVCTRYPPGSLDPAKLHCYPSSSNARGQQWTLGACRDFCDSKPLQILLRARFEAPNDAVAVDDIQYEAILCENIHRGTSEGAGGRIEPTAGSGEQVYHKMEQASSSISPIPPNLHTPLPTLAAAQPAAFQLPSSPLSFLPQSLPSLLLAPITPNVVNRGVATVQGGGGSEDDKALGTLGADLRRSPLAEIADAEPKELPKSPFEADDYTATEVADGSAGMASNCGLDCDFDSNHFCNYDSSYDISTDANARPWLLSSVPVSNPLTGIQHDSPSFARRNLKPLSGAPGTGGTFAYAGNSGGVDHVFELRLKEVTKGGPTIGSFPGTHTLHFDYYLAGVRGRLRVCLNVSQSHQNGAAGEHCPFGVDGTDMIYDSREWKTGTVVIPPGTTQIRFIADRLPKNYIVGLDALRLLDSHGQPSMHCDGNADEIERRKSSQLSELSHIGGSNDEALWGNAPPNFAKAFQ